jgi:hypothetical protein
MQFGFRQKLTWIPATGSGFGVRPRPLCSVEDYVGTNMALAMTQTRNSIGLDEINESLSSSGSPKMHAGRT